MHTSLMYAITLCMKLVSWKEGYIECTVYDYAQALNLDNQYLTLLKVYKPAARTSTLHMVLLICTSRFSVVPLIYRQLR